MYRVNGLWIEAFVKGSNGEIGWYPFTVCSSVKEAVDRVISLNKQIKK